MARSSSRDPLNKFSFIVTVEGFTRSGFTSCETPSYTLSTQKYPEGGAHLWPKQIIDSVEYKPVTLQRGVSSDFNFHNWATQAFEQFVNITEKEYAAQQAAGEGVGLEDYYHPPTAFRKTIKIDHVDRAGRIVKTYTLYNAFPIEYKPASDFASDADDTISMERLVLAYESFTVTTTDSNKNTNPLDIRDIAKRLINRL